MICHFSLLNLLIILSSHLIETDVSFSQVTKWQQQILKNDHMPFGLLDLDYINC